MIRSLSFDTLMCFLIRLWWLSVTVIPEASRTVVFRSGTWYGLIAWIPRGGHISPNSRLGLRLLWKKVQKKEKKNNTSDVMNRIIPHRNPFITRFVWNPWKDLSRETSRHHWEQDRVTVRVLIIIKFICFVWDQRAVPNNKDIVDNLTIKGQGLGKTRWKGWYWFIICFSYVHGN